MTNDKIEILINYKDMIKESWTFKRLTPKEQKRLFENVLTDSEQLTNTLKGNRQHCWRILNCIYSGYIIALGYNPINWREPEESEAESYEKI